MSRLVSLLSRMLAVAWLTDFADLTKHEAVVDGQVYSNSTALHWLEVRSQCSYAHLASVVVSRPFSAKRQKTPLPN